MQKDCQIGERKKAIRKLLSVKRDALSGKARRKKSLLIAGRVSSFKRYKRANRVMFYVTHRSEVQTEKMMETAWKDKKMVAVPVIESCKIKLRASRISCWRNDLEPKTFGIREPKSGRCKFVPAKSIDLVFIPAIAFDLSGGRIGYGKGYYDDWLRNFPKRKRVGLAFDFQVLKSLPKSRRDLSVGTIITEKRTINTK